MCKNEFPIQKATSINGAWLSSKCNKIKKLSLWLDQSTWHRVSFSRIQKSHWWIFRVRIVLDWYIYIFMEDSHPTADRIPSNSNPINWFVLNINSNTVSTNRFAPHSASSRISSLLDDLVDWQAIEQFIFIADIKIRPIAFDNQFEVMLIAAYFCRKQINEPHQILMSIICSAECASHIQK